MDFGDVVRVPCLRAALSITVINFGWASGALGSFGVVW